MRFGMFVPQGWRHDLVGIDPSEHWAVMSGLAAYADGAESPWESIWVYDHFHTTPVPSETEATHEAWTLMSAYAATTSRVRVLTDTSVEAMIEDAHAKEVMIRFPWRDGFVLPLRERVSTRR